MATMTTLSIDDLIKDLQTAWNQPKDLFTQLTDLSSLLDQEIIKTYSLSPPDRQFLLMQESWWIVLGWNHFIENYLQPNTPYTDINDFFTGMQNTGKFYEDNIRDQTITFAQAVSNHATDALGHWQSIQNAIQQAAMNDSGKMFMQKVAQDAFSKMKNDADTQSATAKTILKSMNDYLAMVNSNMQTDQTLKEKYTSQSGELSQQVKEDTDQYNLECVERDALHAEYEKWCKLAETAPVYLVIPFVGIFISVVDAAVFAGLAITWLNKYNGEVRVIDQLSAKIQQENDEINKIKGVTPTLTKISDSINLVMPLIQLLDNNWATYSSSLDNLAQNVDDAFANGTSGDFNKLVSAFEEMDVLSQNWTTVKTASDSWVQIANIGRITSTDPGQNGFAQLEQDLENALAKAS